MKRYLLVLLAVIISIYANDSNAQYSEVRSTSFEISELKLNAQKNDKDKKPSKNRIHPSAGFNAGVTSIDGQVGFAFGALAELRSGQVSVIPQINYWNADKQTDFELGIVSQFYLTSTAVAPYVNFGLGVNFYDSDSLSFTKGSLIAGTGLEFKNISKSFNLFVDAKYKLIASNTGNIPCFIFTTGLKFPFH